MPESPEAAMNYESMLEELANEYPELQDKALELKDDILEMMPEEDMEPVEEPDLELDLPEEDEEISLEL